MVVSAPAATNVCPVCRRRFHQQPSLAAHMRVHKQQQQQQQQKVAAGAAAASPPPTRHAMCERVHGDISALHKVLEGMRLRCGGSGVHKERLQQQRRQRGLAELGQCLLELEAQRRALLPQRGTTGGAKKGCETAVEEAAADSGASP